MEKTIAILGSTGSIGTQTLEVVRENKDIRVAGLSAGSNITLLEKQIREFHPSLAAVWDEEQAKILAGRVSDLEVKVVSGMDGLLELAQMEESQILVTAIVGMIGIRPTMEGIRAGKDIALANKETLVTAGHLIMPMAKKYGVSILPVDSEHSAIFQAIHGEENKEIHKLLITASGGPFRGRTTEELRKVTVADTLKHPNWVMGRKITVDSATLVNKGLEVMEAKWLFDMDLDHIQVVVQPQSIIHSMVEFKDGAIMAQLGTPDMRLPIQYALYYPHRRYLDGDRLDFTKLHEITFEVPDMEILTEGKDYQDAIEMARDAIGLKGITLEDAGKTIPDASDISVINPEKGTFAEDGKGYVTLVDVDFLIYRRRVDSKAVRRNVTLPNWLNREAEAAHINVSKLLQEALISKLGLNKY